TRVNGARASRSVLLSSRCARPPGASAASPARLARAWAALDALGVPDRRGRGPHAASVDEELPGGAARRLRVVRSDGGRDRLHVIGDEGQGRAQLGHVRLDLARRLEPAEVGGELASARGEAVELRRQRGVAGLPGGPHRDGEVLAELVELVVALLEVALEAVVR